MFSMRSKRMFSRIFIFPAILVVLFCAVAAFDYTKQHVHVQMLGTSFNVSNIQQVLVETSSGSLSSTQGYYTITSQTNIQQVCKLIGTATPYNGNQGDFATDVEDILLQLSNHAVHVSVAQTSNHLTLMFYNNRAFIAPKGFLNALQALALHDASKA